jgi:hypothetical protein
MIFSSLKEYFYKMYNKAMVLLLLPMVVFLAIYYLLLSGFVSPVIFDQLAVDVLRISFPILILITLTIVHLVSNKRYKIISEKIGLGEKLELYYPVNKQKMEAATYVSLLMALGFFLTGHAWFSIYFSVILLWFLWQWPSPRRVCSDLKLKGDEREMVMTKGEAFRN